MDNNNPISTSNIMDANNRSSWSDDLFSTLTIKESEKLFESLENDIDQVTETKDKLSLLRSCIELLNRLENSSNDYFSGKVLIFLARVIPMFDISGTNLKSEFNHKPLPDSVIKNLEEISARSLMKQEMEEGETISDDDDYESEIRSQSQSQSQSQAREEDSDMLYERFWDIQKYLNSPQLVYDKKNWFSFQSKLSLFVSKLEKPTNLETWNLDSNYLTDVQSLCLQLKDVNLKRCLLVQVLIILQYFDLPDAEPDKMQLEWASKLTKKIFSILDILPDPDEGRRFTSLINRIFERERIWNLWKINKCQPPKPPVEDDEMVMMGPTYHKRRKISDELTTARSQNLQIIGSPAMTRLWNMKQTQKLIQPDASTYLHIPIERQTESFKDPNYSFRLLRLLRRKYDFFTQTTNPIQNIDEYLKSLAKTSESQ